MISLTVLDFINCGDEQRHYLPSNSKHQRTTNMRPEMHIHVILTLHATVTADQRAEDWLWVTQSSRTPTGYDRNVLDTQRDGYPVKVKFMLKSLETVKVRRAITSDIVQHG